MIFLREGPVYAIRIDATGNACPSMYTDYSAALATQEDNLFARLTSGALHTYPEPGKCGLHWAIEGVSG